MSNINSSMNRPGGIGNGRMTGWLLYPSPISLLLFAADCSLQQRQAQQRHGVILSKVALLFLALRRSHLQNLLARLRQTRTPQVPSPLTGRPPHGASNSQQASTPPISLPSAPEHQMSTTAHPHPKVMPQQPAPAPPSNNPSNNDYNNKCLDDSPHQETSLPTIWAAVPSIRTSSPRSVG